MNRGRRWTSPTCDSLVAGNVMIDVPPRIDDFRARLAARIPCWPDEPTVRAELEQKQLDEVVRVYLNWARRFIPKRPREVSFSPSFWDAPLAKKVASELASLEARIRSGEDLTPHLSNLVQKRGFVPARFRKGGRVKSPEWEDKDYALNAYDAHHLHIAPNGKGDELLYGCFRRDAALLLIVGDHNSFDDGSLAAAVSEARADAGHLVLKGILGPATPYTPKERNELARTGSRH